MAKKRKRKVVEIKTDKAEILVAENTPGNSLANDYEFMQALHDFQYDEGEISEKGFERMKKRLEK